VNSHDFQDPELGKIAPYGVYDIFGNSGWISVGISSDTDEFAVSTISKWWEQMGNESYPNATEIMITADCGGNNGNRNRLWKTELEALLTIPNHFQQPLTVSNGHADQAACCNSRSIFLFA